MARRTRDWNKGLANDLKDTTFMRAFINASLDEGVPVQQVIRKLAVLNRGVRADKASDAKGH
ncbi:MAG TPA: hypothetical protein VFN94_11130 [Nitrospiria bacterium]|nr:hypothetical protein [Nitrospiria bacterium]